MFSGIGPAKRRELQPVMWVSSGKSSTIVQGRGLLMWMSLCRVSCLKTRDGGRDRERVTQ